MKIQDYITNAEFVIAHSIRGRQSLPAGSFVKPIDPKYVPKHVLDKNPLPPVHPEGKHMYVYCSHGIIAIPKSYVRET